MNGGINTWSRQDEIMAEVVKLLRDNAHMTAGDLAEIIGTKAEYVRAKLAALEAVGVAEECEPDDIAPKRGPQPKHYRLVRLEVA